MFTNNSLLLNKTTAQSTFAFGSFATSSQPTFGVNTSVSTAPFGATSVSSTPFGSNIVSSAPFGTNVVTPFGGSTVSSTMPFTLNKTLPSTGFGSTFNSTPFSSSVVNNPAPFGSGFTSNTAFGSKNTGFGAPFGTTNTTNMFGNTQANANQINESDLFLTSIINPAVFGDERDIILQRWNQLQAMYGTGTGLCCKGKSVYNAENPICRLKSVAFNKIPKTDDSDGFVALLIKKSFKDVVSNSIAIKEKLFQIMGIQTIKVEIEDIRPAIKIFANPVPTQAASAQNKMAFGLTQSMQQQTIGSANLQLTNEEFTEVFIKVVETMPNGSTRFVLASNLAAHFCNEPIRSKLQSELAVTNAVAHVSPSVKDTSDYLNGPAPCGLDVEMWQKAKQIASADPTVVPVPIVGVAELRSRVQGQLEFSQAQLVTLRKECEQVSNMKSKMLGMTVKIEQMKRKQMELSNRVLKVFCRQEALRKIGYTLSADEETIKCTLERLWTQIVGPRALKIRLQEILGNPRLSSGGSVVLKLPEDSLSQEHTEELKEYLTERQHSIKEIMTVLRESISSINIMTK